MGNAILTSRRELTSVSSEGIRIYTEYYTGNYNTYLTFTIPGDPKYITIVGANDEYSGIEAVIHPLLKSYSGCGVVISGPTAVINRIPSSYYSCVANSDGTYTLTLTSTNMAYNTNKTNYVLTVFY